MSVPRLTVIPVGRMDAAEVEGALARVSKVLRTPVEMREAATLPKGTEDAARGQHLAGTMLALLRAELARLKVSKTVGADPTAPGAQAAGPEAAVFITDVDLFTPATDAVLGENDLAHSTALLSVRRLREAFYRRKADPAKQRSRLVKEILRAAARIRGLPDCGDLSCALSPSRTVFDVDGKSEHYCAPCWKRLSSGTIRI